MSYRGDSEPEYIDDDEHLDPDDFGRSKVLGGSGAWRDDDPFDDRPEDFAAAERSPASKIETGKRSKRAAAGAERKKMRARNPAPAVASSEERRARLAGKKPEAKQRDKPRPQPKEAASTQSKKSEAESRLGKLRARFGRGDKKGDAQPERRAARFAAVKNRLGGRIGNWRSRFGSEKEQVKSSGERTERGDGRRSTKAVGKASAANAKSGAAFSSRASRDQDAPGAQPSRAPRIESSGWLDLDRKLDLIGVALVFGAIVLVLSALSAEQAAIASVNRIIGQLFGWGAFAVPLTMFAIGMWLIVRHFGEEPPTIDPTRLTGVALGFLGILVFFQYIDSFSYGAAIARIDSCRNPTNAACVEALVHQSYLAGRGGGVIGGWSYSALVNNLTELGGFVVMLMVMTFSAMMITRSSMAELAVVAIGAGRGLRANISEQAAKRRAARLQAQQDAALAAGQSHVRVSKPQAAQLTGQTKDARALPEPAGETMPIPQRLRGLFGLSAKLSAVGESVALPTTGAEVEASQNTGVLQRLFGKSATNDVAPPPPPPQPAPTAGALERFLNLGDDLPFSTEDSPVWQKPARPQSARVSNAPAHPENYREAVPPAPAMPERLNSEPPAPATKRAERDSALIDSDSGRAAPRKPATSPPAISKQANLAESKEAKMERGLATESAARREEIEPEIPAPASASGNGKGKDESVERETVDKQSPVTRSPSAPRPRINWQLPDFRELLISGSEGELDREPLMRQAQIIEDTLASFGAPGRIVEINSGPVITQYGVEPAYLTAKTGKQNRVKVGAIAKLDKDLQLALGAKSIRVEAPVPGKGYVGIEVPNPDSARVSLRDVMESKSYQRIESPLAIALGVSVDGTPISGDLTQMPHLLIAGTTGSGKSVCVNAIINSIIANNSPDTVKFIMIDPKRVELTGYNGVPHLVAPVVVELERTIGVLRWVTTEMDARYKKFSRAGARNIVDYNSILDPDLAPMPYIVVIIDELADLMMMAPDDTERAITRIAALARATGIHLVIATQRPSVDVVTGLIKANCPARIAFAVAGSVDSRVILDQPGAERLLGKGDMLYLSGNSPAPLRMQGVHVSNEEINQIIRYWKLQGAGAKGIEPMPLPALPPSKRDGGNSAESVEADQGGEQAAFWDMGASQGKAPGGAGSANTDEDELYQTAVDMVRRLEKASISLLQRRLRIGYTRAARLMDMMEERGVVGPPKEGSSKPRDVLPQKADS